MNPLRRRVDALLWALRSLVLTTCSLLLVVFSVTSLLLVAVWIGVPLTIEFGKLTRRAASYRRRLVGVDESPYLRVEGHLLAQFAGTVRDPAFRRDLRWLLVDGVLGLALAIVGVVETLLDLLLWWLPVGLANRAHARLDVALLSVSAKSRLALRVQELTESRAETLDSSAAELRRIERDLHDGAQARLVSLGMSLALAEELLARDPDTARTLLAEARTSSSDALAELRDLVRGIHPPVLADRGLAGALEALALTSAVPVVLAVDLPGRLPAPVESAAYFAVAELVTNAAKHAGAGRVEVTVAVTGDRLTARVADDGRGGADAAKGTGLRGIARRLSAFDGTLDVTSPSGGPTEIVMVLPCASSSPKTSPSSATG